MNAVLTSSARAVDRGHREIPATRHEIDPSDREGLLERYPLIASAMGDSPLFLKEQNRREIMCLLTAMDGATGVLLYSGTQDRKSVV